MADPDIASWIKRQLARREWTAVDLARRMGASTGAVSEWTTGKRIPSPQSCLRLADAFSVDPDTVLAIAGHRVAPVPLDDPKARLIALIRRANMSPQQIAGLEAMLTSWIEAERAAEDHPS
ncbi:MAG: helix-turn-helix transcriptional regulator [Thermomicrobiales bacterium]|nr:helix-turn-helix transcriptional regulator [Thermomicrobiales bacterium]